jgi:hypothetical protein
MSLPRLVRNSPDLARLINEGYSVRIQSGHLLIDDVPFVVSDKTVRRGILVCPLDTQGDRTIRPSTHVMWFAGGIPCTKDGVEVPLLVHERNHQSLASAITVDCSFSLKAMPAAGQAFLADAQGRAHIAPHSSYPGAAW